MQYSSSYHLRSVRERKLLSDIFDGYHPQQMAWQTFERLLEEYPDYRNKINLDTPPQVKQKHIITEFMEYLVIWTLCRELRGDDSKGLLPDKNLDLPPRLTDNIFVSFFQKLTPRDIIDRGMSTLTMELPADFSFQEISTAIKSTQKFTLPPFQVELDGNCCNIKIKVSQTSHFSILVSQGMAGGYMPSFEGVLVRPFWQEILKGKLGSIWEIVHWIKIDISFKTTPFLLYSFFPKLFKYNPYAYVNWVEQWISRINSGGSGFQGFNFEDVKKTNALRREAETHEIIRSVEAKLDEIFKLL